MGTAVTQEQFEINDEGIKHVPTGWHYKAHPGSPFSGNTRLGYHGSVTPSGEDYAPHEVEAMAERLWAVHVKKRGL